MEITGAEDDANCKMLRMRNGNDPLQNAKSRAGLDALQWLAERGSHAWHIMPGAVHAQNRETVLWLIMGVSCRAILSSICCMLGSGVGDRTIDQPVLNPGCF